jgi:hypothetical protein
MRVLHLVVNPGFECVPGVESSSEVGPAGRPGPAWNRHQGIPVPVLEVFVKTASSKPTEAASCRSGGKDDPLHAGPECGGQAHGAWFATGVQRTSGRQPARSWPRRGPPLFRTLTVASWIDLAKHRSAVTAVLMMRLSLLESRYPVAGPVVPDATVTPDFSRCCEG